MTANATGNLTFHLYSDSACGDEDPGSSVRKVINGPGDYTSPTITVTNAGTYYWTISYNGDSHNPAIAATACNAPHESTLVNKADPSLETLASAGIGIGGSMSPTPRR